MPTVAIRDQSGNQVGERELPAELFEAPVNVPLMHQVVVAGLAAARRGTHSTKTRGEVSGGGRKPWRQKGTGRPRHGSIRSPIWTGGGIAHGPKPRDYSMRVNKKMKRAALRSALTDAHRSGKLALVAGLAFPQGRTREAVEVLEALGLSGNILVVLPRPDAWVERAFRNLPDVRVSYAGSLSVYEVLYADRVLLTGEAVDALEGREPGEAQAVDAGVQGSPEAEGLEAGAPEGEEGAAQAEEREAG